MSRRGLTIALPLVVLFVLLSRKSGRAGAGDSIWSPPELVLDDPNVAANLLDIQRTADGQVHLLAYLNTGADLETLVYTWRDTAGNWHELESISEFQTPASTLHYPVMSVDNDGSVHVVWWNHFIFSHQYDLFYSQRSPGGGWSNRLELNPTIEDAQRLAVTAQDGHVFVSWKAEQLGLFLMSRTPEGQWSAIEQVDTGQGDPYSAFRLQDAEGNFHFLWDYPGENELSQRGVYHRTLSAAGVWGPIVRLSPEISDPDEYIGWLSADVDGSRLYVAWEQGRMEDINSRMFALYLTEWTGSSWGTAAPLAKPGGWYGRSLAVDDGFVSLLSDNWESSLASTTYLWTRPASGIWTQETIDFAAGAVGLANQANFLHFVWYDGSSAQIKYRWRDPAGNYSAVQSITSPYLYRFYLQSSHAHLELGWQENGNIYYSQAVPVGAHNHYLPAVIH